MRFIELLSIDRVCTDLEMADKQELIATLAHLLAMPGEEAAVCASLETRERLGSTGLGHGVAIPHGRSAILQEARAVFVRLQRPLDFNAPDGQPVDLIAALIVPIHFTDQHLQLLAELAELFSDEEMTMRLRAIPDAPTLYTELTEWSKRR